jgi:phosphosulfolactate synthase
MKPPATAPHVDIGLYRKVNALATIGVVVPVFDLPPRSGKPRATGLTHVLDTGIPVSNLRSLVATAGGLIDVWKFGWGTAVVDPGVREKLDILRQEQILSCAGGTLCEIAWSQGRVDEYLAWAEEVGFTSVEVSRGVVPMPQSDKRDLIRLACTTFTVLSEVGAKEATVIASPAEWADEVDGDIRAGASWVLTEGRESGTVGLYRSDGSVRADVAEAVADRVGPARLVFEAPRKDQQAWLINRFGPDVNLANIPAFDVVGLEALRLGLRADTIRLSTGAISSVAPS